MWIEPFHILSFDMFLFNIQQLTGIITINRDEKSSTRVAAVECVEQLMTTALLPHSHRWRLHSSTYTWGAK